MRAIWNGVVLAESDETVDLAGTKYFPHESISREYFRESDTHTRCSIKGEASYYDLDVGGQLNRDAAWYYPTPKDEAREIGNYVAFYTTPSKGIEVVP